MRGLDRAKRWLAGDRDVAGAARGDGAGAAHERAEPSPAEATGAAAGLFGDRKTESDIPKDALRTIQAGTLGYQYRGILCQKNPFDLALYSRILFDENVRGVLEIGSKHGGSALWFADMLRTFGRDPRVVSVDITPPTGVADPAVRFLTGDALRLGDTLTPEVLRQLPRPLLVVEDSAHSFETTAAALDFCDGIVEPGEFIVIEDGIVHDLEGPEYDAFENGPNRAIARFLEQRPGRYEIDARYCDYFGHNFTWNTNGWLRRLD